MDERHAGESVNDYTSIETDLEPKNYSMHSLHFFQIYSPNSKTLALVRLAAAYQPLKPAGANVLIYFLAPIAQLRGI